MSVETIAVTLMVIDPSKIREEPEGIMQIPAPNRLVDVFLDGAWLNQAIKVQRNCEDQDEPCVIRMFDGDDEEKNPVFASAVLTPPATFSAFTTGGNN